MTPIHHLSKADYYQKLDLPHDWPDEGVDEDALATEYYALYNAIEPILAQCGVNNAYGQGDYFLEPHLANSRGLGLEVTNPRIVTSELIDALSNAVNQFAPRWEIFLGSGECDFGIFISASEAKIWKSEDSLLPL